MLWLTLALIAGQDAGAQASVRLVPPEPGRSVSAQVQLSQNALNRLTPERCRSLLRHASPATEGPSVGMRRLGEASDQERVQMIYLLDQTIDGCRVLLVDAGDLPDANRSLGRNLADGRVRSYRSPSP